LSDERAADCYRKAVELLARRAHLRAGLAAKLGGRGLDTEEVERACDRLEAEGYLDDRRSALSLAEGAFRRKGFGPLRVRAELRRRGVAAETVDAVIAESFSESTEAERARSVAAKWRRPGRQEDSAALARHLERKGYSAGVIAGVLSETG
jgi:regulatory protein